MILLNNKRKFVATETVVMIKVLIIRRPLKTKNINRMALNIGARNYMLGENSTPSL